MASFYSSVPARFYQELDSPALLGLMSRDRSEEEADEIVRLALLRRDRVLNHNLFIRLFYTRLNRQENILLALYGGQREPQNPTEELIARTLLETGRFSQVCAKGMIVGPDTMEELLAMVNCTTFSTKCRAQLRSIYNVLQEYGIAGDLKPATKELVVAAAASHRPSASTSLKSVSSGSEAKFIAQGPHPLIAKILAEMSLSGGEVLVDMPLETFRELLSELAAIKSDEVPDRWGHNSRNFTTNREVARGDVNKVLQMHGMTVTSYA